MSLQWKNLKRLNIQSPKSRNLMSLGLEKSKVRLAGGSNTTKATVKFLNSNNI